ncbi:acyltransferase family protein [Allomesorhizobium camelthorni]|uniref:Acyltransferase n=1 Tax=Allomesorhizobium camelthorni TaxID=475069 RepID=A0A6G4WEB6_9HYPH|nr:acyltransferase [Mesorhizobium camelthorni]NGO52949.1 acyltransferase [Mesorhizobium camelthorni]
MGSLSPAGTGDGSKRVASVDSLRCFAMTAVVAQHCGLMPFGWTGVWLFFVISGFVVTLAVIGRPPDQPPLERLRGFFRRRALRIVPVYYAYVGIGVLVCFATGASVDLFDVLSLLGFFHNVAMGLGRGEFSDFPVGHLWTISVEMQFYLVYGTVLVLASRRTVIAILFVTLVATPLLRFAVSTEFANIGLDSEASAYLIYSGSFLHTDSFAMGALLAFASHYGRLHKLARPLAWAGAVMMIAYATTYTWVNYSVVHAQGIDIVKNVVSGVLWGHYREVFMYTALAVASGGLVALAATGDRSVSWLLKSRLFRRIGEISYGAYIVHALAINAAAFLLSRVADLSGQPIVRRLVIFVLSYAITVTVAELSFRYFESRFSGKRKPRLGETQPIGIG